MDDGSILMLLVISHIVAFGIGSCLAIATMQEKVEIPVPDTMLTVDTLVTLTEKFNNIKFSNAILLGVNSTLIVEYDNFIEFVKINKINEGYYQYSPALLWVEVDNKSFYWEVEINEYTTLGG